MDGWSQHSQILGSDLPLLEVYRTILKQSILLHLVLKMQICSNGIEILREQSKCNMNFLFSYVGFHLKSTSQTQLHRTA